MDQMRSRGRNWLLDYTLLAVVGASTLLTLTACGKDVDKKKALDEVENAIKDNIDRCRRDEKDGNQIAPKSANGKGLGYGINCPTNPASMDLAKPDCGLTVSFKIDGDVAGYLKVKNAKIEAKLGTTVTSNKNLATHVHKTQNPDPNECDSEYVWWETQLSADIKVTVKMEVDGKVFSYDATADLDGYKKNWTYIDTKSHANPTKCGPE